MAHRHIIHCVLFERCFLDIVHLQTQVTMSLTIASAKKHLAVLPSSMTKQCNFEDVPFSFPGRAVRTWLAQKALRGMKVATPSFNWIPLFSTFGHGVSVLASGRLPHLGYATCHSFLAFMDGSRWSSLVSSCLRSTSSLPQRASSILSYWTT